MRGRLIVVEGPDAVGKSTLVREVVNTLSGTGEEAVACSFPGGDPGSLGSLIYKLHHEQSRFGVSSISPLALQCLHVAAHLDELDRKIKPLLASGRVVVLDRYWWSTWVYGRSTTAQTAALDRLIEAERLIWLPFQPVLVLLLTSAEPKRNDESLARWRQLVLLYDELARLEEGQYPIVPISSDRSQAAVLSEAIREIGSHRIQP